MTMTSFLPFLVLLQVHLHLLLRGIFLSQCTLVHTTFHHLHLPCTLVVLESGLGLESGLKSIFAGLGLGVGLEYL